MINFLASKFIKNYNDTENPQVQSKYISLSGVVGLFLNLFLFASKLIVGIISGSIAITSDSFNNLSDSLTSVIAILGSTFARMPSDEKHPQGHGRLEYIASLLVGLSIMYVGFELFKKSIDSIKNPQAFTFSILSIAVLLASILVKIYMYKYNNDLYKRFDSSLNEGVAKDALNDVIATTGIMISGFVSQYTKFNLDGIAGLLISIMVFKTGFEFAQSTVSILLGEAPSEDLYDELGREVMDSKLIRGYHDLQIHNYGRGRVLASLHAEIPYDLTIIEIHNEIDEIERRVLEKYQVDLVIHMDPTYSIKEGKTSEKNTRLIDLSGNDQDREKIKEAAEKIKSGGLVVMPTETVYGLGADGLNPDAINKIFQVKNRPNDNPLILHVGEKDQVEKLVKSIPDSAKLLMDKLWPGPLTIIFEKSSLVPDEVTAGGPTVAIRMPDHKVARELINLSERPIAAPSANISGKPSPTNAIDVYQDLNGKVDIILDGGVCDIGIESTVVDTTTKAPKIYRPGYYGLDTLRELIGDFEYDGALVKEGEIPKSPGQKYKHYAPEADLYLFSYELNDQVKKMKEAFDEYTSMGKKVGVLVFEENLGAFSGEYIVSMGSKADLREMARVLFAKLRELDRMGVEIILAQGVEEKGLGFAIMNRLKKSSGGKIISND